MLIRSLRADARRAVCAQLLDDGHHLVCQGTAGNRSERRRLSHLAGAVDQYGHSGFRTAEQGAEVSVHLATLPADGPTGRLWGYRWAAADGVEYGPLPW